MCAGVISSVEISSRSLGLLAAFLLSHDRSSPASWRRISSGSSVRNRMRPVSFTEVGSLRTSRVRSGLGTLQFYEKRVHHGGTEGTEKRQKRDFEVQVSIGKRGAVHPSPEKW